jgi:hypothetical protein
VQPFAVHTWPAAHPWPRGTHPSPVQQPPLQGLPLATHWPEIVSQQEVAAHVLLAQHRSPAPPQLVQPFAVHTWPAPHPWPRGTHPSPEQQPPLHGLPLATHWPEVVSQQEVAAHVLLAQHRSPAAPQLAHPFAVHTWPEPHTSPSETHPSPEQQPPLHGLPLATHWPEIVSQQEGAVHVLPAQHALPAVPHGPPSGIAQRPMAQTAPLPQLAPSATQAPVWQQPPPHWTLASHPGTTLASASPPFASEASLAWSRAAASCPGELSSTVASRLASGAVPSSALPSTGAFPAAPSPQAGSTTTSNAAATSPRRIHYL